MKIQTSQEYALENRGRSGGFTLVELLVVIAIIGTLAALMTTGVQNAMKKGKEVTCTNNLRNIGQSCRIYLTDTKNRFFPIAKGQSPPAYMSLNVLLLDKSGEDLPPDTFVCPSSLDEIAEKDEDDRFVLSEDTCSYAWLSKKLKGDARGTTPLSSDDSIVDEENGIDENHEDFFIVVFADGSVSKIEAVDLPEDRDLPGTLVGQEGGS